MMKKIVTWLFYLSLLMIAAVLVLPGLVDWNKHKELLIAGVEPYIGRDITVNGSASFKILPNPQIMLEDINIDGFLKLKSLDAMVKLRPLLEGRVEVETVQLVEPVISLTIAEDGTASWSGIVREKPALPQGVAPTSVFLGKVGLVNGSVHYKSAVTGVDWTLDRLNLDVAAETLLGPYAITGEMAYQNQPVSVDMAVGTYKPDAAIPLRLTLMPVENLPEIKFNGVFDNKTGFSMQGELSVAQGSVASIFGDSFLKNIPFLSQTGDVNAALSIAPQRIELKDIRAKTGDKGTYKGSLLIEFEKGKRPRAIADIEAADIKLYGQKSYMPVPAAMSLSAVVQGKNISWNETEFVEGRIFAVTDDESWKINSLSAVHAKWGAFKGEGVVSPKYDTATMMLSGQFDMPVFDKVDITDAKADFSQDKIDIRDTKIILADKNELAGSIVIDRLSETLNVEFAGNTTFAENLSLKGNIEKNILTGSLTADLLKTAALEGVTSAKLDIKAKKMQFRGNDFANVTFSLDTTTPDKQVFSALKADFWDGKLEASGSSEGKKSVIKGNLSGIEIDYLRDLLELKGFSAGRGRLEFDLAENAAAKKTFHGVSGKVIFTTDTVTVDDFNPSELPALLSSLAEMPKDANLLIEKSLGSLGKSEYDAVTGELKLENGLISFNDLAMSGKAHTMNVSGGYDLAAKKYDVTADITAGPFLPTFNVYRASEVDNKQPLKVKAESTEGYIQEHLPQPAVPETSPIGDILQRLDTPDVEEAPEVAPLPEPVPLIEKPVAEPKIEEDLFPTEVPQRPVDQPAL